jgi:hypothetical protein
MKINNEILLFKTIVGSQAYGTNTPESDIDYKGVYVQSVDTVLSMNGYKEQITITDDEVYYDIKRFLELLAVGNPTVLELLWAPEECIVYKHPVFDILIENRDAFLTKQCAKSFGGYALSQIRKAQGLNKKQNWEKDKVVKKEPLDFVYTVIDGNTHPIKKFLEANGYIQEYCGLTNLNHMRDCYALYYDEFNHGYKGIIGEKSNELRLSSIPKSEKEKAIVYYNKDSYSRHCKDYKEYVQWLANRNEQRYTEVKGHNQKIDGKNLMHCVRLVETAVEILTEGTINVKRKNADKLLKIRRGEFSLDEIIISAKKNIVLLDELYKTCNLPDSVDEALLDELVILIRTSKFK